MTFWMGWKKEFYNGWDVRRAAKWVSDVSFDGVLLYFEWNVG